MSSPKEIPGTAARRTPKRGNSGRILPRSPIRRLPTSSSTKMAACGSSVRQAMLAADFFCSESTIAKPHRHRGAALGTVATRDDIQIVEGELPIERIRVRGIDAAGGAAAVLRDAQAGAGALHAR